MRRTVPMNARRKCSNSLRRPDISNSHRQLCVRTQLKEMPTDVVERQEKFLVHLDLDLLSVFPHSYDVIRRAGNVRVSKFRNKLLVATETISQDDDFFEKPGCPIRFQEIVVQNRFTVRHEEDGGLVSDPPAFLIGRDHRAVEGLDDLRLDRRDDGVEDLDPSDEAHSTAQEDSEGKLEASALTGRDAADAVHDHLDQSVRTQNLVEFCSNKRGSKLIQEGREEGRLSELLDGGFDLPREEEPFAVLVIVGLQWCLMGIEGRARGCGFGQDCPGLPGTAFGSAIHNDGPSVLHIFNLASFNTDRQGGRSEAGAHEAWRETPLSEDQKIVTAFRIPIRLGSSC
ncbi:unnamed protein product [Victoria cruziana]